MEKDGKNLDHKFVGVEFQIFLIDYHTWVCPVFMLEDPLQGDLRGISNGNQGQRTESTFNTFHSMKSHWP